MELKPLERTDRSKSLLNAALEIYRQTILPEAQNPERQILYWIDHSRDNLADEFKCFAIELDNKTIGYLQYSFFREEQIFFFEYLCVRDSTRKGLLPSIALTNIEKFLAQNYSPGFTIVFEIAQVRDSQGEWKQDRKLISYFKKLGFRTVCFNYRYPILQSYVGELSYPADLMVWLPSKKTEISPSEMRTFLRCIYFKHYLRWDRPFLDPERFAERERLINELYSQQVAQIGNRHGFGTIGYPKSANIERFADRHPQIGVLLERVFGPKLPRIFTVSAALLGTQWVLGGTWVLIPFVLAVAAVYCLAEDTAESRKLFIAILSKLKTSRPRLL